jgi:thiol-disulfide isomerase/thioredoxin
VTAERPRPDRRLLLAGAVAIGAAALGAGVAWRRIAPSEAADGAVALFLSQTMPDAAGRPFAFAQLAGSPLIVNFWATWCPPCVEEMPELSELHRELGPRGVRMIGIGIDSPSKIAEFAAKHPVSYPLVVAGMGGTELAKQFGNTAGVLPYTVLVGRSGSVAQRLPGRVDIRRLRAQALELAA